MRCDKAAELQHSLGNAKRVFKVTIIDRRVMVSEVRVGLAPHSVMAVVAAAASCFENAPRRAEPAKTSIEVIAHSCW